MRSTETFAEDRMTYWAKRHEPGRLLSACWDKIENYQSVLKKSRYLKRTMRSWRYWNGIYYDGCIEGDTAIKYLGPDGELAGLSVNDFRSLGQQVITMLTKSWPAVEPVAKTTDGAALQKARLSRGYLEHKMREDSPYLDVMAEHAFVLNAGFLHAKWNPMAGPMVDSGNLLMTGEPQMAPAGDVELSNPWFTDLAWDHGMRAWPKHQWIFVRERVNKYDLAAKYPELEEDILGGRLRNDNERQLLEIKLEGEEEWESDLTDRWCGYHLPCDVLPEGMYIEFLDEHTILPEYEEEYGGEPYPMPYKVLPICRLVPGELLFTSFGYSPALDMQGPQEALNAETSIIATMHKNQGMKVMWSQEGDVPNPHKLTDAVLVVTSQTKPERLDLDRPIPENFGARKEFRMDGQLMSGINDIRRGTPEGGLKGGSGSAFAFLDAKAVEANGKFQKNFDACLEWLGMRRLEYVNDFASGSYKVALAGKHNRPYELALQKGAFDEIERVAVRRKNPLLDTIAGKAQMADLLLQQKRVTNEEWITFVETGNLEPMLESATAQLAIVREENEWFLDRRAWMALPPPVMLITDDHTLHIREHASILNTNEARNDLEFRDLVMSHMLSHIQAHVQPIVQEFQLELGYNIPLPAQAPSGVDGARAMEQPQIETPGGQASGRPATDRLGRLGSGPESPEMPKPARAITASGTPSSGGIDNAQRRIA